MSKILIASVLKPVDDTRMYEKIGLALAKIDKADIHIAGFASNNVSKYDNIEFHNLFKFNRLSSKRLFSGWKIWKLLIKLKPEVIIANTHELLVVIIAYQILFGCKLVYDVQENYFKNLWYGNQFPIIFRHILAIYVRLKERILAPFFKAFLLAERCYEQEMPFFSARGLIIENKFRKSDNFIVPDQRVKSPLNLLYTGTIAEIYGIFDAIELARTLLEKEKGSFRIIGHCPDKNLLKKVNNSISRNDKITLIGNEYPLPHDVILREIAKSNLGIMGYRLNPAIKNRIPTRVFEYMACKLPFIYPEKASWSKLVLNHNAGIPVDYNSYDPNNILTRYFSSDFYNSGNQEDLYFDPYDSQLQEFHRYL